MGKIEDDLRRKIRNEHFARAFDYIAELKQVTQTRLAGLIDCDTSYISKIRNGTRPVTDEAIEALIRVSATIPDGQIYSPFLYGESDYMLLRNVPDEEIIEVERRRNNPDYDLLQQKKSHEPQAPGDEKAASTIISLASTLVKETEELRRQLSEERANIKSLKEQMSAELDDIKSLHATMEADRDTIRAIREQLSTLLYSISRDHQLPMAAENKEI